MSNKPVRSYSWLKAEEEEGPQAVISMTEKKESD